MFESIISTIEQSKAFLEWDKHAQAKVAHIFVQYRTAFTDWQVGYVTDQTTITTFQITGSTVVAQPPATAFQEKPTAILPLDLQLVSVDNIQAVQCAEQHQKEMYAQHPANQMICILQMIDGSPVWNITIVTYTFKTLNIHIDARSKAVKSTKLIELFDWQRN